MQPAHLKLLLLVLVMLGVGGYVVYVTMPAPAQKNVEPIIASVTSTTTLPNVTNLHIEKNGDVLTLSGQAKEAVETSITGLSLEAQTASGTVRGSFDRVSADLLIERRGLSAGTVEVDLQSLKMGSTEQTQLFLAAFGGRLQQDAYRQATFVITRVEKGAERGAVAVGTLTLNQISQEVRVPFAREGGGLRGGVSLDLASFGLQVPGFSSVFVRFLLGVK